MTRKGDALRSEIAQIQGLMDDALPAEVEPFSSMALMRNALVIRREGLLSDLSAAEVGRLDVIFDGEAVHDHALAIDVLANTLGPFQEAVAAVAQAIEEEATAAGRISRSIRDAAMLRLAGTFEGSFGIRLAGPEPEVQLQLAPVDQLADPASVASLFEQSVDEVVDTLMAAVHPDWEQSLVDVLADVPARARAHLEKLAQGLSTSDSTARFVWRKPEVAERIVEVRPGDATHLRSVLTALESSESLVQVNGTLVALDLLSRSFAIQTPNEEVYRSKAPAELLVQLQDRFNREVTVLLRATETRSAVGQRRATRYVLAEIR